MVKPKRKRTVTEALRVAIRSGDFRKYMSTRYPVIPTDKRFEELLKRLDESEKTKK